MVYCEAELHQKIIGCWKNAMNVFFRFFFFLSASLVLEELIHSGTF